MIAVQPSAAATTSSTGVTLPSASCTRAASSGPVSLPRRTSARTGSPSSSSIRHTTEPIRPVAPVTRTGPPIRSVRLFAPARIDVTGGADTGNMTALATDVSPGTLAGAVGDAYKDFCAGFHGLLRAIAEHERAEAFKVLGVRSEDDWLRRVFDVEWRTARDWARQARLIGAHPEVGEQFATGEVSVDKLRSMAELVA